MAAERRGMSVSSAAEPRVRHRCPACQSSRVERRSLHGWFDRTVLPLLGWHAYRCLECDHRFRDRPYRRDVPEPTADTERTRRETARQSHRRRRPRWRLEFARETTPYSRAQIF